jgi:hypothetical protein
METQTENSKPDSKHDDWKVMAPYWEQVTAIVDGRAAVIEAGETYLPKFNNESQNDYDFRLMTAKFTNIYRDIIEGLAQKPFSHELHLEGEENPPSFEELVEDIDGRGNHLHVFAGETFFNGINKAIEWILIDYTKSEGLTTVKDEKIAGVRPYWIHIPSETVIWIESEIIQGREQLTLVKILEEKGRVRTFWRLNGEAAKSLKLGDGSADAVLWKVEVESEEGSWTVVEQGKLTIDVIPMVPFVTGRRKGTKWRFNPPMRDAADLQIELYQQETSLKYIKTMTCFPMLAGNGVMPDMGADGTPKQVPVGPLAVLYAPPNADGNSGSWEWIGTDAVTLQFLAGDIKETTKELRELGRQPLTAQSGNLTVINAAVSAEKGNSAVQAWALQLKDALENALKITALWLNETTVPTVSVFTDFAIEDMDGKSPEHLMKMREAGDISLETLWIEFRRREILGPEFNSEDELEKLLNEIPGDDGVDEGDI